MTTTKTASKTTSRDGTTIAFDRSGQGPPVILVLGAFNDRMTGAALAASLAARFTVLSYDRRGRGESGDTLPYAVEREIEDLEAVIRAAGGSAAVFGYSSGAVLALRAAASGLAITKLALYESPPAHPSPHAAELAALIAAGRRGDAVEYFQRRMVGIPEPVIVQLRQAPFRPALEAMAHTLVYEATILGGEVLSAELLAKVRPPTLAIAGGASPPVMRETAAALVRSLPDGRSLIIDGATHDLVPTLLAPVLERFFASAGGV
jgi:pimeloyl-ACP methyl ester carboxylesterase